MKMPNTPDGPPREDRVIEEELKAMEKRATRQEVLLAAVVLSAISQPNETLARIEDISSQLFKLRDAGIDIGDIALRRIPGGFYSDDIEMLIGHYLAAGYASQRSPVRLTDRGREVLDKMLDTERRDNPGSLATIEAILHG
jgi:hypothetical protein